MKDFFYVHTRQELKLASDNEIKSGLGAEGVETLPDYGFTPASKSDHVFTKSEIIKSTPPSDWRLLGTSHLKGHRACPDFAIRRPLLPFSVLGEVKYFRSPSPQGAVRELYNAARQAVFYLGAFRGEYDSIMIVVADASSGHSFFKGMELLKPDLLKRFGPETGIHLLAVKLI